VFLILFADTLGYGGNENARKNEQNDEPIMSDKSYIKNKGACQLKNIV
jgi:hypothetical protein